MPNSQDSLLQLLEQRAGNQALDALAFPRELGGKDRESGVHPEASRGFPRLPETACGSQNGSGGRKLGARLCRSMCVSPCNPSAHACVLHHVNVHVRVYTCVCIYIYIYILCVCGHVKTRKAASQSDVQAAKEMRNQTLSAILLWLFGVGKLTYAPLSVWHFGCYSPVLISSSRSSCRRTSSSNSRGTCSAFPYISHNQRLLKLSENPTVRLEPALPNKTHGPIQGCFSNVAVPKTHFLGLLLSLGNQKTMFSPFRDPLFGVHLNLDVSLVPGPRPKEKKLVAFRLHKRGTNSKKRRAAHLPRSLRQPPVEHPWPPRPDRPSGQTAWPAGSRAPGGQRLKGAVPNQWFVSSWILPEKKCPQGVPSKKTDTLACN